MPDNCLIPYPYEDESCRSCPLWSYDDDCCGAANAEECAQINGLEVKE